MFHTLKFVMLRQNNLLPSSFNNFFEPLCEKHPYHTRQVSHKNLYMTCRNTDQYGKRSIKYTGPNLWNKLSTQIKLCKSVTSFMNSLRRYMIESKNKQMSALVPCYLPFTLCNNLHCK